MIGMTERDQLLCPVPLFHAFGFGLAVIAAISVGASVEFDERIRPQRDPRNLAAGEMHLSGKRADDVPAAGA